MSLLYKIHTGQYGEVVSMLEGGADPNERGKNGMTPLHQAICSDKLQIVVLLIHKGADTQAKYRNMSPIISAAGRGKQRICQFFVTRQLCTRIQAIETIELLATDYLKELSPHGLSRSYSCFIYAMRQRFSDTENHLPKNVLPPMHAYDNRIECQSISELERIKDDPGLLYLEACMVRERILGSDNPLVSFFLLNFGRDCSSPRKTGLLVRRWQRAVTLMLARKESIDLALVFIVKRLLDIRSENLTSEDLLGLIRCSIDEIVTRKRPNHNENDLDFERSLKWSIVSTLCLMSLALELESTNEDTISQVQGLAHTLVAESRGKVSLIHLMFDRLFIRTEFKIAGYRFPSTRLLKLLVRGGLNINQVDHLKDTFLHAMASQYPEKEDLEIFSDVIHLLIDHGLHLHKENAKGETVRDILMRRERSEASMAILNRSLSLKCDAARIVKRFKLPYEGIVPRDLYDVIECNARTAIEFNYHLPLDPPVTDKLKNSHMKDLEDRVSCVTLRDVPIKPTTSPLVHISNGTIDQLPGYREINKAIPLNGKAQTSTDSNEFEQQTSEDPHGLQSRMLGSGTPLSEERYPNMNSPERMQQDGGHSPRQQPRTQEYDDSEDDSEDEKRYQNLPDQELTGEQVVKIHEDLKAKKRCILNNVLKTNIDHLQTGAKRFNESLKGKNRAFIRPNGSTIDQLPGHREINKAIPLNGKAQTSMDSNEFEEQTSEDSHGLQSRMLGSGIPLSEERYPRGKLGDQRFTRKENRVKYTPSRNLGEGRTQFRPPVEARVNKIMQSYGNIWSQREPGCQRPSRMETELPNPQPNLGYPFSQAQGGGSDWRSTTTVAATTRTTNKSTTKPTQLVYRRCSWSQALDRTLKEDLNPEEGDLDEDAIDNEDIEDDPTVFLNGC